MTQSNSKESHSDNNICVVIGCNNHIMDGNFGLEGHRYGYCQIHKIEGTAKEVMPNVQLKNINKTKEVEDEK